MVAAVGSRRHRPALGGLAQAHDPVGEAGQPEGEQGGDDPGEPGVVVADHRHRHALGRGAVGVDDDPLDGRVLPPDGLLPGGAEVGAAVAIGVAAVRMTRARRPAAMGRRGRIRRRGCTGVRPSRGGEALPGLGWLGRSRSRRGHRRHRPMFRTTPDSPTMDVEARAKEEALLPMAPARLRRHPERRGRSDRGQGHDAGSRSPFGGRPGRRNWLAAEGRQGGDDPGASGVVVTAVEAGGSGDRGGVAGATGAETGHRVRRSGP